MIKEDYYRLALASGAYRRTDWVYSVFTELDIAEELPAKLYPFYTFKSRDKKIFSLIPKDPSDFNCKELEQVEITDYSGDGPLLHVYDDLVIGPDQFINVLEPVKTTYGRALINCYVLIFPFGSKIPFKDDELYADKIESIVASKLHATPEDGSERDPKLFYVDELLRFNNAANNLTSFNDVFVNSFSEKCIVPADGIAELKRQLLEEYGDRINDPVVLSEVEKKMIDYYKKYMEGDSSTDLLNTSSKSYSIVFKKLYMMLGSEEALDEGVQTEPIVKSLDEGWDLTKIDTLNTITRAGSFKRGARTALGGELVKWLFRISSNVRILEGDCGSTTGLPFKVTESNVKRLAGFSIIEKGNLVKLDENNVSSYIGRIVILRSPMYCKFDKTDYCSVCAGERLSKNPTGASAAISNLGSVIMYIFMKAMHGKALATKKIDFNRTII